jgi:hypothetical protein
MALLQTCHDDLSSDVDARRALLARAFKPLRALFRVVHKAITTAGTRRLQNEPQFYCDDGQAEPWDGTKYPQRPLILGDKWDF